jgi:hypothetical protein
MVECFFYFNQIFLITVYANSRCLGSGILFVHILKKKKSRGIECLYIVYTRILHILQIFILSFFVPVAKSTRHLVV